MSLREETVKIGFEVDNNPLQSLIKDLDNLKKKLTAALDGKSFDDLTDNAKKASTGVDGVTKSLKNMGQTSLSKVESGLKNIGTHLDNIGKKAAGAAFTGLKKIASISFKSLAVGLGAAATAAGAIIKSSVSAYADYEQLVGGVDTIFKGSSETVQKNADRAYKIAGISANQYMETVTSFSASLIQSLKGDTAKAAELSDKAISDMSDNANKMGTDMSSLQYAYQGFAKQNYMMLDNLKLGYGGTKTEMERLLKDAGKLAGKTFKISSYADVIEAIHVIQENMGITGTTAKEAEHTISGSLNSMKAAWSNLLPSLIRGGDSFDKCVDDLVTTVGNFANNIKPAITKALSGLGKLIEKLTPIIEEQFPILVKELLPPLIQAATSLLKGLIKSLPSILSTFAKEIPNILKELGAGIADTFPALKSFGEFFVKYGDKIAKFVPVLFGIVLAFQAFKKVRSITSVFSGLFGKSSSGVASGNSNSLLGGLSSFAKIKQSTILKALANITILAIGLGALVKMATSAFPDGIDLKLVLEITAAVGILGGVGTGLTYLAGIVGKIPVSTVAKGLANIAIIIAGMGALIKVATMVFPEGVDFSELIQLIGLIGILGTIGSILSVFAGIVGLIPIPVVLSGLANIALVLGGFTAIVAAFGALTKIEGFTDFIDKGGEILVKICNILGEMVGSLIGGIGEGITNSLPKIGENISKFAESLKPMFSVFNGVDAEGMGSFFTALGAFLLQLAGEKLLSLFAGETNLADLGTKLNDFATKSEGFFTKVAKFPAAGFENAKLLFNSLAGISGLPKEGGVAQWFTGTINYDTLASGLGKLAGERVIGFFNAVAKIPQAAFENAKTLFNSLAGIDGLPKEGGVAQWFTGTINYDSLASGLGKLSSDSVMGFFNAVAKIPQAAFEQTKLLFNSLAEIKGLPKEGGLFQWFTGDSLTTLGSLTEKLPPFGEAMGKFYSSISQISDFTKISQLFEALGSIDEHVSDEGGLLSWAINIVKGDEKTGLEKLGDALKKFGEATSEFFAQINTLNLSNLNGLWDSLKRPKEISADALDIVDQNVSDIVKKISELPKKMGDGIRAAGNSLKESLVDIWVEAAKAMAAPVNKIIEGANWILGEFGSDNKIASWTPYARGTSGHKGGNALVNDGRGAELVQMPNGRTFIPQGRNVFIPNAPKGMKVLPAEQTARLIGKKSPTFHYANGTGDIDIWNYLDDANGLVNAVSDKYVSYDGLTGFALNAGKGLVTKIKTAMSTWTEKLFDEFGAKSLADYVASAGVEQWRSTVMRALKMEGQYSAANVERTLYQMQTESGGNPRAINLWDSNAKKGIPSKGLMQVIDPTFKAYARDGFNSNIYDPLSNILASIRYAVSRYGSLGKAYQGHGYAKGVGSVDLSAYTPENSSSTVINSRNKETVENATYAPVFNLTISGTTDDRVMARKVQRWVKEALNEAYESMNRKNPAVVRI